MNVKDSHSIPYSDTFKPGKWIYDNVAVCSNYHYTIEKHLIYIFQN